MNAPRNREHGRRDARRNGALSAPRAVGGAVLTALIFALTAAPASAAPAPATTAAWLRFAHFAVGTGPVAVRLDGAVIDAHAIFEAVTPYRSVAAGRHQLTVTDSASHALVNTSVSVAAGKAVTVTAVKGRTGLDVQWFGDDLSSGPAGQAKVRVIDTEPSQPTVFVNFRPEAREAVASTGDPAAPVKNFNTASVPYGAASPYINLPAGRYNVQVTGAGGKALVSGRNWPVSAGTVASLAVVQSNGGATLEVIADAAGPTQTPTGAMATGFGGAAALLNPRSSGHTSLLVLEMLGIGLVLAAIWFSTRRAGRAWPRFALATVGLAGVGITGATLRTSSTRVKAPVAQGATVRPVVGIRSTAGPETIDLASAPTGAPRPTATPTRLSIPAIGVDSSIGTLGLNLDGSAQVPANTTTVGWLTTGPTPGQPGPAVILGHVDSRSGPGVFFRLGQLIAGQKIDVTVGSVVHTFAVQHVESYPKNAFPTETVFGPVPDRALRLVTCGGPFDTSIGHYKDNVVVFATEISTRPR